MGLGNQKRNNGNLKNMNTLFKIPVSWEMYGYITVEADNLENAIEIAEDFPLPDGSYIEGSFRIDNEALTIE